MNVGMMACYDQAKGTMMSVRICYIPDNQVLKWVDLCIDAGRPPALMDLLTSTSVLWMVVAAGEGGYGIDRGVCRENVYFQGPRKLTNTETEYFFILKMGRRGGALCTVVYM